MKYDKELCENTYFDCHSEHVASRVETAERGSVVSFSMSTERYSTKSDKPDEPIFKKLNLFDQVSAKYGETKVRRNRFIFKKIS